MLFIAVDLGAGSGRVFLAGNYQGEFLLEERRRFTYPPAMSNGRLRWNFELILNEVTAGIKSAGLRAMELGESVQSVGVDSWAVDYGLVDKSGSLIEQPVCYRDSRTRGVMDEVFERAAKRAIFQSTGIQFLPFNTLYQLYAQYREGVPAGVRRLLMIPDLINLRLSGKAVCEYTNATTTQLVNAETGEWDEKLLSVLGIDAALLPEIVTSGTDLGELVGDLAVSSGLERVRVIATASHDTASAVAGTPLQSGWAFISSGTWSLVGTEREFPLINEEVESLNFTNEGGVFGTIRFLKNVMGLWILEACRRLWAEAGFNIEYDKLFGDEGLAGPPRTLIYPDDSRFLNPENMLRAIQEQVEETGQNQPSEPAAITRMILDSLALRYRSVLGMIETLTGDRIEGVHIVGGGSKNRYLNQATANATGLTVHAGPEEATVIGNVLVQAVTAGEFSSLADARCKLSRNIRIRRFNPVVSESWRDAVARYAAIESRYADQQ